MYHDPALGTAAKADPRPKSAVSTGTGIAGLAGLFTWIAIARWFGMDGPYAALANVAATALPMVLWSVFVDKVHRNPSTGIDWGQRRPWRETLDISLTKLAGLWAKWAEGDRKGALAEIPDELVDQLIVHGSPEECREHIGRYIANGVTCPALAVLPFGLDPVQAARDLAPDHG